MDVAKNWFRQAREDLDTARALLDSSGFYAVAQFCHQAVEKGLKAVHMHRTGALAPRGHSLTKLADLVALPGDFRPAVLAINPTYALSKYPDAARGVPADLFDREQVELMINNAKEVLSWGISQMPGSRLQPS